MKNPPSQPPKKPAKPAEVPIQVGFAESMQRWKRDSGRLYHLLGFKPFAVALAALLILLLWVDESSKRIDATQKRFSTESVEYRRMKALVDMRKKIDEALKRDSTRLPQEQARAIVAENVDAAAVMLLGELQGRLGGVKIENPQLTPLTGSVKGHPASPVVAVDAEFAAVPEQVVHWIDSIQTSQRLMRIAEIRLEGDPAIELPKLKVRARVEALYMAPEVKPKGAKAK
ncbi:hypothetical protein [Chitinimonas lacunae]|uniref:Uncharacterized protein n=1 Tax=Chitinimonas lacunae TaxID=1963018 RepID=A0ABV8MXX9_9NEIS